MRGRIRPRGLRVNNVGIASPAILATERGVEDFDKVHMVNLKGTFHCHKYQIAQMQKKSPPQVQGVRHHFRGSIVNVASLLGLSAGGMRAPYSSSKHGIVSLTRCDARSFAEDGIRINCVCRGNVDTPMLRDSGISLEVFSKERPMRRVADPEEVAEGIAFLRGGGATAITGISLPVDNGSLLYHIV